METQMLDEIKPVSVRLCLQGNPHPYASDWTQVSTMISNRQTDDRASSSSQFTFTGVRNVLLTLWDFTKNPYNIIFRAIVDII